MSQVFKMNVSRNLRKGILSVIACFGLIGLVGCETSAVKRDPIAPAVADEFTPAGHILLKPNVEEVTGIESKIPQITAYQPAKIPNINFNENEIYSITAINVPVNDLLFKLAQDANKEIDIYAGVEGNVTINAINQPLDEILARISNQLNFIYEVSRNTIIIRPDFPEWRNYEVDYVNINKTSEDRIDMKMSVSSNTGGTTTRSGTVGSSSQVVVKSEHNFWQRLEDNVSRLAQLDPYTTSPMVTEGQEGRGIESSQNVVVNPETGSISVYTSKKKHDAVKDYIETITARAQRQVMIEATVVEVELNDNYQAGIDWSFANANLFGQNGGLALNFPFQNVNSDGGLSITTLDPTGAVGPFRTGSANILANLEFLQEFGDSKVLSSPKIMAVNNQAALLKVVENLVYFTVEVNTTTGDQTSQTTYETEVNTVPVGFTMSVTPFVSDDGEVTLNIRPTISRLVSSVEDPNPALAAAGVQSLIPVIQEKEMSSVLKLRDRQTAIIGGLIEDKNSNNRSGVPGFSEIPFFGDIFSKRGDNAKKSELVIFIRPVIVKNPDIDAGDLKSVAKFLKTQPLPKKEPKKINMKEVIPVESVDIFEEFPE